MVGAQLLPDDFSDANGKNSEGLLRVQKRKIIAVQEKKRNSSLYRMEFLVIYGVVKIIYSVSFDNKKLLHA